jgi:ABC-type multidrug transport system, ATPase and permease components
VGVMLFLFDMFVSVKAYYAQMARLTVTSACLDRIDEVFVEKEMKDSGSAALPAEAAASVPEIEYKNVTFGYTDKDVLHDISFKADKGEMIALVGPSGGGKSTIANLLARFWDVDNGSIAVRGKDVREVSMGSLMDNISMVFQRVYLFQDTIFNNIAIGRPNATKEEVEDAAKRARCYDFIMQLPEGFDTVIGEGGASLSGGEQQRISIARCILKDAPIVILDEATASVDADNERAIQEAISELCRNKTLLVIAHRLKTIRSANKILLISDGQIRESGTHEELMAKKGYYSHMVELTA